MTPSLYSDSELLPALRRGEEDAFQSLVEKYHPALVRLATVYANDRAAAEEVAQDTWIGVLKGLNRFEGRSSLKTWIFTILVNRAKTRGQRDSRSLPFSALLSEETDSDEPTVDPARFVSPLGALEGTGHWRETPANWDALPEAHVLSEETGGKIRAAIADLPTVQRQVITLRDIDGFSAEEVCNILEISETNQRVLLHRARAKVRKALEEYLNESNP